VRKGVAAAGEVYRFLNAEENLQVHYPDVGHDFPPETRLNAYRLIDDTFGHTPNDHEIR
jgi:hypothetical protein